jgi:hypothetical protein
MNTKEKIASVALLAASPLVKAADGEGSAVGSKLQIGINHLVLDEMPLQNIKLCLPPQTKIDLVERRVRLTPNEISIAINPYDSNITTLVFTVSDMRDYVDDQVLFLVYSTILTPSPEILTPRSINKLGLSMTDMEIIGMYNIPAVQMESQSTTRIGTASPASSRRLIFNMNLDNATIPQLIHSTGTGEIYVQAALMKKTDFESARYGEMILSEVDTIKFIENECPEPPADHYQASIQVNNNGEANANLADKDRALSNSQFTYEGTSVLGY